MANEKSVKFTLRVDLQCGVCGSLTHVSEATPSAPASSGPGAAKAAREVAASFPKFCPCCGASMERYCLRCQKRAEMYFEEWWPEDNQCFRTYSPAKRCCRCNAMLEAEGDGQHHGHHKYQN